MAPDTDRDRWTAVTTRDRAADGQFVYGVTSTRIFCRPSCPSRRPRRERVRFFSSPELAAEAGFRPCMRCRPLEPPGDPWTDRVARACDTIARAEAPPTLAVLARGAGSSRYHFLRNFVRVVGVTPREFAEARRFAAVRAELRAQPDVTTALFNAGYGSTGRFYERAAPRLAMTPSAYQGGAAGQRIRYVTVASSLGRLLVAATDKGVCAVTLGRGDEQLLADLRTEFPGATLVHAPGEIRDWVSSVVGSIAGQPPQRDLPLDVRATSFQWQVWNALRAIPFGETRSYGEIAEAIGRPGSARAVARACASNPVAVVVPCHRVVPAAGGVGGYRWGSDRKERLLVRERRQASKTTRQAR